MAAQYDVNLEKCALLKCLCGSALRFKVQGSRFLYLSHNSYTGHN